MARFFSMATRLSDALVELVQNGVDATLSETRLEASRIGDIDYAIVRELASCDRDIRESVFALIRYLRDAADK